MRETSSNSLTNSRHCLPDSAGDFASRHDKLCDGQSFLGAIGGSVFGVEREAEAISRQSLDVGNAADEKLWRNSAIDENRLGTKRRGTHDNAPLHNECNRNGFFLDTPSANSREREPRAVDSSNYNYCGLLTVEGSPSRPSPMYPTRSAMTPAQVVGLGGCDLAGVSPSYAGNTLTERNDPASAFRECLFCFSVVVGLIFLLAEYQSAKIHDANGNPFGHVTAHERAIQKIGTY